MERAARLINKHKASQRLLDESDIARGVWPTAVGAAIARHTVRLHVVRDSLVVEVEDAVWQKQLYGLSRQILARVQQCMGSVAIQNIEFRVGIPRREPQQEAGTRSTVVPSQDADDEAERIQDPMLKKLYQRSRKRSIA